MLMNRWKIEEYISNQTYMTFSALMRVVLINGDKKK